MRTLFKKLYFLLPGKRWFYFVLRRLYSPSVGLAGYLKFKGSFQLNVTAGIRIRLNNDYSTLPTLMFWKGFEGYEPQSLNVWIALSKQAKVVFDLGANFGLFGLLSKGMSPESEVHFFEPLARNVARVQKNLEINNFSAFVNECAIGSEKGHITFYDMDSNENTIGSIDRAFVEMHRHHTTIIPIEVDMISLDDYVKENAIGHVDLMKIDVEGADYEVIKGAKEVITKYQPTVLIEVTDDKSAEAINELLDQLPTPYHIFEVSDQQGLVPIDLLKKSTGSRNYLMSKLSLAEIKALMTA